MTEQLPPHSPEAEQGVLGCVMLSASECLDDCLAELPSAEVFFDLKHRTLYEAMVRMHKDKIPIDTTSLCQRLRDAQQLDGCGGIAHISSLPDQVPSAANLGYYLEIVRDKFHARRLLQVCTRASQQVYGAEDISLLMAETENAIGQIDVAQSHETLNGKEVAQRFIDDLQHRYDLQGKRSGLVTDWTFFNELTDGLQFGELTIIAARPSVGKSVMAVNVAERVCLIEGIPTVFVTLEMSPASLAKRMFASHFRVDMKTLRNGQMTKGQFNNMANFNRILADSKLFIINGVSGMSAPMICALVKRLWRKHGVKLVIVDYLQKITPARRQEKRAYEVGDVSTMLKALAQELNVALLSLAQLSRESEKDKGRLPRLSDLADSSQLEKDADCVALLHRKRDDPTAASLTVAKQRDGETGIVNLKFNGTYCRFENP